ncbi:hypothetical protein G6F56_005316 [Rhizopus delemar]|uniref:Uncharacterized protein n=1 Tax=Rhizopus stolonifer TaxID=4846 RepID=A0A367KNC1_RHIST|nr:hypothetical protein G6F56_005316 [Rhizopus delemar]RCI03620.1 hypothetical protein CU098_012734 [Rhizopus stolonifer]
MDSTLDYTHWDNPSSAALLDNWSLVEKIEEHIEIPKTFDVDKNIQLQLVQKEHRHKKRMDREYVLHPMQN